MPISRPILRRYVDRVAGGLPDGAEAAVHAVERRADRCAAHSAARTRSCPVRRAASSGWSRRASPRGERLIGFDMGGTSTDVSHYAGRYELADESMVAGVRIRAPMMQIHTVAAGGGSICRFDGMRFRVGPESAGAKPGPACYRGGGPLTVTDCNLFLGRIAPDAFPGSVRSRRRRSRSIRRRREERLAGGGRSGRASARATHRADEIAEGFLESRSTIWPTRSARSRSRAAMTSRATRSPASAARAASMPAGSPMRSAWSAS